LIAGRDDGQKSLESIGYACLSTTEQDTMFQFGALAATELGVGEQANGKPMWLLSGSGVVAGTSRDQAGDEGVKQGFAASARVVHELKEAEIKGQLVLRDAPVRAQPGA